MEANQMKKAYVAPQIVELGSVNNYVQTVHPLPGITDVPINTPCDISDPCFYTPS